METISESIAIIQFSAPAFEAMVIFLLALAAGRMRKKFTLPVAQA